MTLRQLERPSLVVADPGASGAAALRDQLVDVRLHAGAAAPIAGALADADEIEERAGAPLAVALLSDANLYHSSFAGVLDNAIARREVLHVLVVNRDGSRRPLFADEVLEATLRAMGLHVSTVKLDDPQVAQALRYAASRVGPRVLVCYAGALPHAHDEAAAEGAE
jgi:hypothetical protein